MYHDLYELLEKEFTDGNGNLMRYNEEDEFIGDAVNNLFVNAQANDWIRDYLIRIPCIYESLNLEIYMLIISWVNSDGSLGTYNESIEVK